MTERNDSCPCGSGKKYKKCHLLIDQKNGGKTTTTAKHPQFTKSAEAIDGMRRSGAFNGEVIDYIRPFVTEGVSTAHLNKLIHDYTVSRGHIPACLKYRGYPKSCCISINNVVCHGIPSEKEILKNGDIVNVDCTTIVDGFFGDSSETFCIGQVPKNARHLVWVTAHALLRGIAAVAPGRPLTAIADAIEPFVNSQQCSVVHDYTGHGIGRAFHENFTIYHHRDKGEKPIIMEPGMTFTIEPMINLGGWEVTTDKSDKWTVRTKDGSLSAQFEHTVVVTQSGVEVLTLTPSQRATGIQLAVEGIEL